MSETVERTQRERAGRRAEIVDCAVDVFAEFGFGGASIRELAARAGILKGHLTYYFPTKDDLLFELVDDLHDRFLDGIAQWARERPEDDEPALLHYFTSHVLLVFARQRQTRVAYDNFRFLSRDRRRAIVAKRDRYERTLSAKIAACRRHDVSIADVSDRLLSKSVLGVLNWPYQWYSPWEPVTDDELAQLLAERALATLRPEPPPRRHRPTSG